VIAFKNRQDLSPMPRRGLNPRHTTIPSSLPPRITSPTRSIPWMLTSKKPVDADPLTYAQIDQNNGLLPITLRLTAQPTLDNWKPIRHDQCAFPYLGVQMPLKPNSSSRIISPQKSEFLSI